MVAVARGQITIWVCMDGDDAYNAWVSPSSIAVPALATGEVSETDLGPSSNAVFSVFASKGISSLKMSYSDGVAAEGTCNWRIGTCAGMNLEHVEGSNDKLCVTDMLSDFAAGIIVFNLEGKQTVNLQVTVVKQKQGEDGISISGSGHFESSKCPYKPGTLVSMANCVFISNVETNNPPLAISRFKNGSYRRKRDGGYILAGKPTDLSIHQDWRLVSASNNNASYWLDTPVSSIGISSIGVPSPSSFQVTCRMSLYGNTQYCSLFYLAARKYNGTWTLHVSPEQTYKLMVPATSGYTQFLIRAYRSLSDANAWNDNFVCEKGVGVSVDGADGAFLYDCGPWKAGTSYIWNDVRRDKVIHPFDGVYYNFLVKAKGMTVTAAPSSVSGDTNWEAANKFTNIATDTLFADGANIANFMFKGGVMRSQNETDGVANMILNGTTGYFHCINADIKGKVVATSGSFENVTVKNISSPNNAFQIDASGNVQITGKFQTAASGNRVVIDPSNNTLSFVTSGGVANCAISFGTYGGYSTANIFLRSSSGSSIYDAASIAPHEIRLSDKMVSGFVKLNSNELLITGNNKTAIFGAGEISIQIGSTKYTGYTGYIQTNKVSGGKPLNAHFYRGILYKVSTDTN